MIAISSSTRVGYAFFDVARAGGMATLLNLATLVVTVLWFGKLYREWVERQNRKLGGARKLRYRSLGAATWLEEWAGWAVLKDMYADASCFIDQVSQRGPALKHGDRLFLTSPSIMESASCLAPSVLSSVNAAKLRLLHRVTLLGPAQPSHPSHDTLLQAVTILRRGGVTLQTSTLFSESIQRQIAAFSSRKYSSGKAVESGASADFGSALRRLVQAASLTAFFGIDFPASEVTGSLDRLAASAPLLAHTPGFLQRWLLPDVVRARNHLLSIFIAHLASDRLPFGGPVQDVKRLCEDARWSLEDVARLCIAFTMSLLADAPDALPWALLHTIQAGDSTVSLVCSEATSLFAEDGQVDVAAATIDAGMRMPWTTDIALETLRLYSVRYTERTLLRDVVLKHRPSASPSSPSSSAPAQHGVKRSVSFCKDPVAGPSRPLLPTPPGTPPTPALKRASSFASSAESPEEGGGSGSGGGTSPRGSSSDGRPPERIFVGAGTRLVFCHRAANTSAERWGRDAAAWRPSRWASDDGPASPLNSGGGMIDVRHVTMIQIRLALGLLLHRFDVSMPVIPPGATSVPLTTEQGQVTTGWSPGHDKTIGREGTMRMRGGFKAVVKLRRAGTR